MILEADILAQLEPLRVAGILRALDAISGAPETLDKLLTSPSAFIPPPGRQANQNEVSTGAIRQTVITSFGVIVCFNKIGGSWADQTSVIRKTVQAIEDQLLGWTIDRNIHSPAELQRSDPLETDLKAGVHMHGIQFLSREHVRKP